MTNEVKTFNPLAGMVGMTIKRAFIRHPSGHGVEEVAIELSDSTMMRITVTEETIQGKHYLQLRFSTPDVSDV